MTVTVSLRPVTPFGILYDGEFYWHEALRPHVGRSVRCFRDTPLLGCNMGMVCFGRDWNRLCVAPRLARAEDVLAPPEASGGAPAKTASGEDAPAERLSALKARLYVGSKLEAHGLTYADVAVLFDALCDARPSTADLDEGLQLFLSDRSRTRAASAANAASTSGDEPGS
jgi:hypothetical protein